MRGDKGVGCCQRLFFIFERRSSNHDIARDFDHFIDDQKSEEKKQG